MSRFPCQYFGSKRAEAVTIIEHAPELARAAIVVEPFAGSAALSMALYCDYGREGVRYVLNDADPGLVDFLRWMQMNGVEKLAAAVADKTADELSTLRGPLSWFVSRKTQQSGLQKRRARLTEYPAAIKITRRYLEGSEFFTEGDVEVTCGDWLAAAERFKDDPRAAIYLDPPYFSSHNGKYHDMGKALDENATARDLTQIFVDILGLLRAAKAAIVLSTSGCALLREIYGPWLRHRYSHTYGMTVVKCADGKYTKKTAEHLVVAKGSGAL